MADNRDVEKAKEYLHLALAKLGADMNSEHLKDTPGRIAKMWLCLFSQPRDVTITTFENPDEQSQLVIVRDIPFTSWCAHHLLPFVGKAHVGYLPDKKIVGLSKLPRIVKYHANSPQVQEQLTVDIINHINESLQPRGAAVLLEADHTCMSCRGVHVQGTTTQTCKLSGNIDKFEFFQHLSMKMH